MVPLGQELMSPGGKKKQSVESTFGKKEQLVRRMEAKYFETLWKNTSHGGGRESARPGGQESHWGLHGHKPGLFRRKQGAQLLQGSCVVRPCAARRLPRLCLIM